MNTVIHILDRIYNLDNNYTIENKDSFKVIKTKYGDYYFSGYLTEEILFNALIHFNTYELNLHKNKE